MYWKVNNYQYFKVIKTCILKKPYSRVSVLLKSMATSEKLSEWKYIYQYYALG